MSEIDLGVAIGVLMLVRVGQTLLLSGCVRSKNAAGLAVRGVLDFAVVALAVWAVGGLFVPFNFEEAARPIFAWEQLLGNGAARTTTRLMLPGLLILTGATLGSTAERTRLGPPLIFSGISAGIVLPILYRVGLWLFGERPHAEIGLIVATIGGGAAAIVLARAVGPRKEKFNRDLSINFVPGHAVALQLVGLLLLAAGWGVTTRNGMHVLLGLGAATVAGATFGHLRFGKIDVGLLVAAGVGGLAAAGLTAITPGAGEVNWFGPGGAASVIAGGLAGVAVPWAVMRIETSFRIDDVAGFGAAYGVGGAIGLVVGGLTRRTHTAGGYFTSLGLEISFGLLSLIAIGGTAYGVARVSAARGKLRVSEPVEYDGLDLSELDVNAYPDFQQTMIKSHHLRQL